LEGYVTVLEEITAVVAVYGAALATYNLIIRRRENQRQLKVKLSVGYLGIPGVGIETALIIEAFNTGSLTITLTSVGMRLPGGQTVVSLLTKSEVDLPHELKDGKNCHFWYDIKDVAQGLANHGFTDTTTLTAYVTDGADNTFESKPLRFDINRWLNEPSRNRTK
jgi:hypothetical protein